MRRGLRARGLVVAALAAGLWCCARPDDTATPRQRIVDLAASFPFTEGRPPTRRIALGAPRDRALLGQGWAPPETQPDGVAIRRNAAAVTRVAFDAGHAPGPLRVVLRGRVELPDGIRERQGRVMSAVRVRVNEAYVGLVRMTPEMGDHVLEVPAARLRPGRNELMLRHVGTIDPRGSRPRRGATFVHEAIAFEPIVPAPPGPRLGDGGDRVILAPGVEAAFFFGVPDAAELRLAVEPREAAAALRATIEGDDRAPGRLALDGGDERRAAIDLPPGSVARLVLHAAAEGPALTVVGPAVWGRPPRAAARQPGQGPVWRDANVLVYVVDTLRADRLGCYGNAAATSPAIDRLAHDGVLFENVVAQSSWTRPATASMLTGQYPMHHGAITLANAVSPDVPTAAEVLRAAGYRTGGFVTNVNVADQYGFGRGFEVYRHLPEDVARPGIHAPAAALHAEFLRWLDDHAGERVFAYLHATDPHGPYTPSPESIQRLGGLSDAGVTDARVRRGEVPRSAARASEADTAYLRGLYGAEIADLDAAIGGLVDELDRRGLLERTIVVLVADHGEEFREHGGFGHGRTLYREQLHVPLIVRLPGRAQAGTRVARLARQVDVLPTILALVGVAPPGPLPGVALLDAGGAEVDETVAETRLAGQGAAALVGGDWKAILRQASGAVELYDRRRDPGEQRDVAAEHPIRVGYARQRLLELTAAAATEPIAPTAAPALDDETIRRLQALGYVH